MRRMSSSRSDGHTVVGMDADLAKALGQVLGLKVNVVNATFDTIIPGLASGKYDLGMSSFTDTKERAADRRLRHLLRGRHVVLRQVQRRAEHHVPG